MSVETTTNPEPGTPPASAAPSEIVIETRNLRKVYRDFWGREKVRALNALDLMRAGIF